MNEQTVYSLLNGRLSISLKDIQSATENFSDSNCIGKGISWKLYEGKLGNTPVFAKRWSPLEYNRFIREVQILLKYKHENIFGLVGYCNEMGENIIVYEHASNEILDKHLDNHSLTWMKRLKICINVANGLEFFHKGHHHKVQHGYIESGGILLDNDWNAKISNFESASFVMLDEHVEVHQYFDVCDLGVILIDMLTGRLSEVEVEGEYAELDRVVDSLVRHYDENGNLDVGGAILTQRAYNGSVWVFFKLHWVNLGEEV
ncbi:putative protein kinase RLK-Pelle-WAK family [Helianthus anomalus]